MEKETKTHSPSSVSATCQSCQKEFTLTAGDLEFSERFKTRPVTWCFDCRLQRRMSFRNENKLYKRKCDAPGHTEEMLSIYAPEKPLNIYDQKAWWSDSWEGLQFGKNYDFNRPFFEQFQELIKAVPWMSLFNMNSTNSDYCNMTTDNKDCYLVFGGDYNENCMYSTFNFYSRDCLDNYMTNENELSYEVKNSRSQYKCMFINWAKDCTESAFLDDCTGLSNCIGCVNMKNAQYCIFNEQYSKEEYEQKKAELDFSDANKLAEFKQKFNEFKKKFPKKYADIIRTEDAVGNRINDAKNIQNCFDIFGPAENLRDVFLTFNTYKDSYSCSHGGHGVEECYESTAIFGNCQRLFGCILMSSTHDAAYSYNCRGSSNLFGCVGLRDKQYCILNKQYTKEEYEELVPKIKAHMDQMPYTDAGGRVHQYGDFFPSQISPFAYNETVAQEYFPLTKEDAIIKGFTWRDQDVKSYQITIPSGQLPPKLSEITDEITKEVIECAHKGECQDGCSTAFRILPQELTFYRRLNVALPTLCPSCRHASRLASLAPLKLFAGKCKCGGASSENSLYKNTASHFHGAGPCPNEFKTPYDPASDTITYCEQCYQAEVA
ncbi:MAG: hypothetical protein COU11_02855 [Candidatus Harrisonbacteria bacterium CG10_big_fil_rev_8_21_14_0_10_49_15]|uniref:Uncharacterized protein n=1 Tax=Candidatus Harrisonbacteria bacterium CG10_big_fil_rev_8_21_14_0_10_49_15 TaxID=1974587 RepID=A0A2H0UKL6_9BACT|nr:MAG: hypothetical protein COU11_02855 [Candidatus Harrisonbacteria bacterium CG10_big_fil_rev_8_21_14_0_10_49_15]